MIVFLLLLLIVLSPVAGECANRPDVIAKGDRFATTYAFWRPLLADEVLRDGWRPEPRDLYKFLHQGVMGPAHAIRDTTAVHAWLHREWEVARDLPLAGRPPMLLPLRPDGRLVRVDLVRLHHHASKQSGGMHQVEAAVLDTLLWSFIETAARWLQDPALLRDLWDEARADTALWSGVFSSHDLAELHALVSDDWPSLRHSEIYRSRSSPHYRVVELDLLPQAWRNSEE